MSLNRRIDRATVYGFCKVHGRERSRVSGSYVHVMEVSKRSWGSNNMGFVPFDEILHPDIPYPVKEMLCAAIRARLLVEEPDNKRLEALCLRDKLRSRQAKGLSTGELFKAGVVSFGSLPPELNLSEEVKETIYDDPV